MQDIKQFISAFRQAAPYIHQHRHRVFVFCIQERDLGKKQLQSILHDIAILQSLHIKIVIVFEVSDTINQKLASSKIINNRRVITHADIDKIIEVIGKMRVQVEAILSMGLAHSSMQGASIRVISGNFVIAKPVGIIDGVDFGLAGEIRKIRTKAIEDKLNEGEIVLVAPVGFSTTGEIFSLVAENLASEVAVALKAEKLLFLNDAVDDVVERGFLSKTLTPYQAKERSVNSIDLKSILVHAANACQKGLKRVHIVKKSVDGAILAELFTRDGYGIMVTEEAFDRIEQATIEDMPGLLALIRPLEEKGILVRRSRELLEAEIESFYLLKKDQSTIGCAALYFYPDERAAELGCLVVADEYRGTGFAETLLSYVEQEAHSKGIERLFCLTTHTSHWFLEHGFYAATIDDLPLKKRQIYNYERSSKPFVKLV